MKLSLPFDEAISLALSGARLPDMVASLTCTGSTVSADIDLTAISSSSAARRFAFAAAGTVAVTARLEDYSGGVASVIVTAHARGLPAHRLLPYLLDPINAAVVGAGLPDQLVTVRHGEIDPVVRIDVQKAVDSKVEGVTITALSLTDAVIRLEADVARFGIL